jgi:L-seryl-tRNA(Ser) seleniumtransferase
MPWRAETTVRVDITTKSDLFRKLPSVDELLREKPVQKLIENAGRIATTTAVRETLAELREKISAGAIPADQIEHTVSVLATEIERRVQRVVAYSLQAVVNATGVILHTNLGRAPLPEEAMKHVAEIATRYSNLEFDLEEGERGRRDIHIKDSFQQIFARQVEWPLATIVVNNNAAAVLLALNTLAEGGEVIVSRGELVEIGGSFRIPDVMAKSQAILREVGTTNRTRIGDYEKAITEKTKLLLRVHRSNFAITGFTEQTSLEELVTLGRKHKIPVLEDLGSGALMDLAQVGVRGEPTVYESLRAGVDVVTYSGDKMFGGPQAGLVTGTPEIIGRIRQNQLFRALRVDKMYYAALEATLRAYLREDFDSIPALRMMRLSAEAIGRRAEEMRTKLPGVPAEIIDGQSVIGGGAAPGSTLPTKLLAVSCDRLGAQELAEALRRNTPPIITRVENDRVLIDLRTVFPEQDAVIVAALLRICV